MSDLALTLSEVLGALREPVDGLLDPSRRVSGPFLLGSAALALAVLTARGLGVRAAARELASPRVWLHRSALADYRFILAKAVLRATLYGAYGVSMLAVAATVMGWLRVHAGPSGLHAPALAVGAAYTLAAFLAEDWRRYQVHRLMHRVPLLWEFHKVHHEAEVLTPFTLYRTHPAETSLNGACNALAVGAVTGLCAWAFGPSLRAWELFGVDALGVAWSLAGANLRHSHVWLSYGPRVERFLLSPAQHQIHHSADPRHADRNFGSALALWDRLAGSLYVTTARPEPLRFGLAGEAPAHTVTAMLLGPFVAIARRALGAPARRHSRRPLPALAALAALSFLTAACTTERFDRAALLQSFGRCTTQTYGEFVTAADGLASATAAHAHAPTDATRDAAREAWRRAIDVWQRAELLRFGPAAALDTLGGRGMREQIYAWPDVSRCLIEQQIASRGYEGAGFAGLSTNARGLAAVEYLLFYAGADNACPAEDPINATGTWAALGAGEIARRKAAYARLAAADVAARARALVAAWEGSDGFLRQLTTAGTGSTLLATQQVAFSVVAEGPFHLDTDTKDLRLNAPLMSCPGPQCPRGVESPWADRGKQHLRNNLAGARLLLEGCPAGGGLGYDDLLEAAGATGVASRMRADLAAADAAVNAIPGDSLSRALVDNRDAVARAHAAVRELTDLLKGEFSMTLQITSQRVEGDND